MSRRRAAPVLRDLVQENAVACLFRCSHRLRSGIVGCDCASLSRGRIRISLSFSPKLADFAVYTPLAKQRFLIAILSSAA